MCVCVCVCVCICVCVCEKERERERERERNLSLLVNFIATLTHCYVLVNTVAQHLAQTILSTFLSLIAVLPCLMEHSCSVDSTVASQQEGPGFDSLLGQGICVRSFACSCHAWVGFLLDLWFPLPPKHV